MTVLAGHDRIGVLDGLRAMAILHVVALHVAFEMMLVSGEGFEILGTRHITWFFMNGWIGVQLFFVLSGFLIAGQLYKDGIKDPQTRKLFILKYLKRRFFRLAPVYYFMLAFLVYVKISSGPPLTGGAIQDWAARILYHTLFLQDYLPPVILGGFWSLAVEAKFYLLAPFLVLVLLKLPGKAVYIGFFLLFAMQLLLKVSITLAAQPITEREDFFLQIRIPFHMVADGLLAGVLCRFLWKDLAVRAFLDDRKVASCVFVAGISLFLWLTAGIMPYYWSAEGMTLFVQIFYTPLAVLAFSLMLLGLMGGCIGYKLFEMKIFRGIAVISYSLYLIHMPLTGTALNWASQQAISQGSPAMTWLLGFLFLLAISIPFATLSYFLIEKPFIDRGRK